MRCPSCDHDNRPGAKFCEACAAPLNPVCVHCGAERRPTAKFCDACGASVSVPAAPSPATPPELTPAAPGPAPAGERRQLTVLFCDLVGSTPLSQQLDAEEWRDLIAQYQQAASGAVARFGGHVAKNLGDGLLIYFGWPTAREDDPERAVRAGLAIVDGMAPVNAALAVAAGTRLTVRIGIHTGAVVIADGGEVFGESANVAARVQTAADPDTVVITAATQRLVAGLFVVEDRGPQVLKGVREPVTLYRVVQSSGVRSRLAVAAGHLTRFVGRDMELGTLVDRWQRAQDGEGQNILVLGEAGVGKSRLVYQLHEHLAAAPHTWLECGATPYTEGTPFYPIIALATQGLAFAPEDTAAEQLGKLEVRLGALASTENVALLADFLALPPPTRLQLSPELQRRKTIDLLAQWNLAMSEVQPLVVFVEDLHWCDASTLELLGRLIAQSPTARVLLLATARPEFTPPWPARSNLTTVQVARLTKRQARDMVTTLAGTELPAATLDALVARADGVPLYVEELTKAMAEPGAARGVEAIPASLADSLMGRLDRLGAAKEVAQVAAVLGREFSYELLRAVSPWDEQTLQRGLGQLVKAELLYQRGLVPEATYLFKHALIQQAAYQSLLRSTRKRNHLGIAQALETRFPHICELQPELLAQHYSEAGLAADAIPYWLRAGQRAIQTSANLEAIGHLTKGLELVQTLPESSARAEQELTLQTTLGVPLLAIKGMGSPEVERVYARARDLALELGDTPQLSSILWGLWWFYEVRGDMPAAGELAEQLLAMAQRHQDVALLMQAHRAMGQTLLWLGQFVAAREHLEKAITLYVPEKHRSMAFTYGQDPSVVSRAFAAHVVWYLGFPNQALRMMDTALALATELAHPFTLAVTLDHAAWLHQYRREGPSARDRAEATMTLAAAQGFPFFFAQGTILHGWSLAEQGRMEEGITEIRRGLTVHRATGAGVTRPYWLLLLAEVCAMGGHVHEGLEALDEALTEVLKNRIWFCQAELLRLRGELLLKRSVPEEAAAEASFHEAIEIARRQQARSLELRAVMSLSRLRQRRGKPGDMRRPLAELYARFTEGFDTRDLKEAKALLDDLT
jgi:class 3 adenylate cyclase/predicted ATPase